MSPEQFRAAAGVSNDDHLYHAVQENGDGFPADISTGQIYIDIVSFSPKGDSLSCHSRRVLDEYGYAAPWPLFRKAMASRLPPDQGLVIFPTAPLWTRVPAKFYANRTDAPVNRKDQHKVAKYAHVGLLSPKFGPPEEDDLDYVMKVVNYYGSFILDDVSGFFRAEPSYPHREV